MHATSMITHSGRLNPRIATEPFGSMPSVISARAALRVCLAYVA